MDDATTPSSSPPGRLQRLHEGLRQSENLYMMLLAVVVGIMGGVGAVAFRELIHLVQVVAWGDENARLATLTGLPWWVKLSVPAVGGLLVGLIVTRFAREARGHGVPEVMAAVALREGRIRPRVMLVKTLASALCIGTGGSTGREGPIVQIGAALASALGQLLKVSPRRLRTLVGCGAAAGIAATFNAPVAGALFAVEVILGDFGVARISPIIISSVVATAISREYLGNTPSFEAPGYDLVHVAELLPYALLGILAAPVAILFTRSLHLVEDGFGRLPLPVPSKAMVGGFLVGCIGLAFPQIFGVGYETINQAMHGQLSMQLLAALIFVKIAAVALTLGSGGSGGVFAPSLFIGAMLGGAMGTVVHALWPDYTGESGAYALVGMGAVVAAATHAPITAILMLFEITGDYRIILPLMVSCITGTLLAMRLSSTSVYTLPLLRRGIDIQAGRDVNVLRRLAVRDVMREEVETVAPGTPIMEVLARLAASRGRTLYVVDEDGQCQGVIGMQDIHPILAEARQLDPLIVATDVAGRALTGVAPGDNLDTAMRRLERCDQEALPVLDQGKLVGAISMDDVVRRYNAETFKRDMAYGLSTRIDDTPRVETLAGVEGFSLAEVATPTRFVGCTLAQLDVRNRHGVTVLLVKHHDPITGETRRVVPHPTYIITQGDSLLVIGETDNVKRLGDV